MTAVAMESFMVDWVDRLFDVCAVIDRSIDGLFDLRVLIVMVMGDQRLWVCEWSNSQYNIAGYS